MTAPVREGEILAGKYRVDKVLGVGGMGVVVAARHIELDDKVAIKFMLPEALANAEAVARFAREARAAVKIKSEHVARVSDVGKLDNGAPYMVMEYLEGSDLSTWLTQRGVLPIEQASEFILQACEAIAEAHALGIVHRDLKPANLFVIRRADGVLSVKVLDFGISKMTSLTGSGGDASMTKTSSMMGSPFYMSPEQMQSSKDVDSRGDIWALGIILYELVTGAPPFSGESMPELILNVMSTPPPPLRDKVPGAPDGFEAVILRCLDKDRGKRFESVGQLAVALLPFAPKRAKASVERISGVMKAAGFSASALALPPSSDTVTPSPAGAATGVSWGRTTTRKGRGPWIIGGSVALVALVGSVIAMRKPAAKSETGSPSAESPTALPQAGSTSVAPPTTAPEAAPTPSATGATAAGAIPVVSLSSIPVISPETTTPPPPSGAHACNAGTTRCTDQGLQRCESSGRWGAAAVCRTKGEVCRDGACIKWNPTPPVTPVVTPASPPPPAPPPVTPPPAATTTHPAPQPAPNPKCNPNYFFDSQGNKHFKPECF